MKNNYIKNRKILKNLLIIILIILFIKIFFLKDIANKQTLEDILFFKLLGNSQSKSMNIENVKEKEFNLKVNYKNIDFKSINLSDTIDKETLIYEKIAPGTSGSFNIILESNKNSKYKILFYSINEKPRNLNFKAVKNGKEIGNANTLEELQKELIGYIRKDEKINILINWYWKFEDNKEKDIQDTEDAKIMKKYQFNISTVGEELM